MNNFIQGKIYDDNQNFALPLQGNIGSLLKINNNTNLCTVNSPVSGGPNCTGAFIPNVYSRKNVCGSNCVVTGPSAYGMQPHTINTNKQNGFRSAYEYNLLYKQ